MTPIDQTMLGNNRGDCLRASIATLFDLEIVQVPHFILFDDWVNSFHYFIWGLGYEWLGCAYPKDDKWGYAPHVNGFIEACVASKTFEGKTHSVIVDQNGLVVHDPNPNKKWLGINIVNSEEIKYWSLIVKREKE